jgi:hypothetical protein
MLYIPLAILFGYQTLFQNVVPSVLFSNWETMRKYKGLSPAVRENGEP